jgi:hypothetical protein
VGGGITGKAMVPIIRRRDQWDTSTFDRHVVLKTEAEVANIERKIRNRGYYLVRMTGDDYDQLLADPRRSPDGSPRSFCGRPSGGSSWPTTSCTG